MILNPEELLERFNKTKDIILPTFHYVSSLDDNERDFCEETFNQIAPCYLFMYSVVVNKKVPSSYISIDAQEEMYKQLKEISGISAAAYKIMQSSKNKDDEYTKEFIELLETFLLMYYLYHTGQSIF